MNDYYPFLLERVSRLEGSCESRRKTYDSVRDDLFAELARPALRVPEAEIAGERRAFDAAVQKIEAELARDGGVKVAASRPSIAPPAPDSAKPEQTMPIETKSAPAMLVGETAVPGVKAPTMAGALEHAAGAEHAEAEQPGPNPGRSFRADDFRVLPRDAAHDFGLEGGRRAPGGARTVRRKLVTMTIAIAIVVCGVAVAAIYFSASIKTLLGI
jgi:hypothetical protein